MSWDDFCRMADDVYGTYYKDDDADEFVFCPECGEPIFKEDYNLDGTCPACGFDLESEAE